MSDWVETVDKKSGKTYYYNRKTRETSWKKPQELTGGDDDDDSPDKDPKNARENWYAAQDKSSGKTYYYNKVTKETRWTKPPVFDEDEDVPKLVKSGGAATDSSAAGAEEDLGDPRDWKKVVDQKTGRPYYYNRKTKATSWKKPKGFDEVDQERSASSSSAAPPKPSPPPRSAASSSASVEVEEKTSRDMMSKTPVTASERAYAGITTKVAKKPVVAHDSDDDDDGGDDDGDDDDTPTISLESTVKGKTSKKLLDDDEEEVEEGMLSSSKFDFAKHRKGWLNRTFHIGQAFDEKKLLQFKKSLIKKSILKQNREFDAEAVQAFKNIMSYMGDRRSGKSDIGHAKKVIANALGAPETLKDEVFLQLCKQVTNHPNLKHAIKGWELMALCMASFPPSRTFKKFMEDFLERSHRDETNDSEIRRLAGVALERLEKVFVLGPRLEVPSSTEIERDQAGAQVALRVYTLDNTPRTIEADSFTLMRDVKRQLIEKIGLTFAVPFAIYELSFEGEERILEDDMRALDIFASWERIAKEKKVSDAEPFKFVYKAELVLKTSDKTLIDDDAAMQMMYIQAVHDVTNDRYPFEAKDVPSLAALQLQASYGDYKSEVHTSEWVQQHLEELVPNSLIKTKKSKKAQASVNAEYAQKIITKYTKLAGVSTQEARLSYLDYVQEWPLYGAAFVTVEQKQLKDYPPYIKLAVTCDAVLLVHPETRDVLDSFGFHEIVTWGYSDEKFILVVGNLVQQRKLFFKTNRGKYINKLVHDYVKTKVPTSS